MKMRLLWVFALAMLPCAVAAPAKPAKKVVRKAPVLQWPRISQATRDAHWERIGPLQELLNAHGAKIKVDGNFGDQTEAAIKKFQRAHRLKADGVVGPETWPKLVVRLKRGNKGQSVKALQSAMLGHNGENFEEFKKEPSVFGFETERAVREYQTGAKLKVDGIAGPQTWCILFNGKVLQ